MIYPISKLSMSFLAEDYSTVVYDLLKRMVDDSDGRRAYKLDHFVAVHDTTSFIFSRCADADHAISVSVKHMVEAASRNCRIDIEVTKKDFVCDGLFWLFLERLVSELSVGLISDRRQSCELVAEVPMLNDLSRYVISDLCRSIEKLGYSTIDEVCIPLEPVDLPGMPVMVESRDVSMCVSAGKIRAASLDIDLGLYVVWFLEELEEIISSSDLGRRNDEQR